MTAFGAAQATPMHEASADVFARIGAFLAEHRLGSDPANYAFAHAVVSDPAGALARSVARLSDGGFRLSRHDIERLGGSVSTGAPIAAGSTAPPAAGSTAVTVDGLIARTQVQVDGFADTMRAIHAETRGFGRDLAASAAAIDAGGAMPAIDEVTRLTSAMIARVRESEARLETATREADDLRVALDEARGSARRDPLTDLPNRRAFAEAFTTLDTPAALAICDIDHFKQINDGFGHAIGDRVLRAIGQALLADCPDCLVARYGGEEFVVLVTGGAADAVALLDRARDRVAVKRFRLRDTDALLGTITFSAGVAAIQAGDLAEDALARADAALYAAKAAGRNRVYCAPDDSAIHHVTLA